MLRVGISSDDLRPVAQSAVSPFPRGAWERGDSWKALERGSRGLHWSGHVLQ